MNKDRSISLGQLDGAVLTYKDSNGETIEVKFDSSGCNEQDDSKKDDNDIPNINTFEYKSFP